MEGIYNICCMHTLKIQLDSKQKWTYCSHCVCNLATNGYYVKSMEWEVFQLTNPGYQLWCLLKQVGTDFGTRTHLFTNGSC